MDYSLNGRFTWYDFYVAVMDTNVYKQGMM